MLQNGAQDVLQRDELTPQLLEHSVRLAVQCKHLQDQLEFSDTRYHIISDLISDFAWSVRCEPQGRFTFEWITGPFHRLLGMPVAEINLVTDWKNYIFPDDLERVQAHIRKVYAGEADGIEFRVCDRGGKIHWIIQRTCSVKNEEDGHVVRIYGAGRDITERKEMEDRQRQDEEAYRALVERSLQELYILQDGRVCFANPTALNNSGYSLQDLQAFSQDEILNVIYASDPAAIANLGVSDPGKIPARHEFRRVRKDGSISWVAALSAQIQYQGRPAVQVALVDITERVQAEEAYRALVHNSLQELLIFQDGRIVFANPSAVRNSGYELNELLSFSAEELLNTIHPDDVDELVSIESNILAGKPYADRQEMRVVQKSGAVRWVEAMRTRIEFHGRPATQTIQFDITERKLTEERLRYRHAIEGLVTSISTRFINLTSDSVDSGIRHSLQSLGRFAGSDYCYVYLLSSDFAHFVDGYEWCQNGVKSRIEGLIGKSFEPYAWSLSYFKDRMPVYIPCVDDIPSEGSPEKIQWVSEGIQSVLAIPLILNNMLFGYWGFDFIQKQKTWAGEDIRSAAHDGGCVRQCTGP
jgi:PAS domain S-box-containing protein